mmetsp:Transcript_93047/g.300706  ORF Transcript_93047/g.300706 Transcript_93047/m.300706 type:complete len:204 (+) Transcript_93047:189-800(+)
MGAGAPSPASSGRPCVPPLAASLPPRLSSWKRTFDRHGGTSTVDPPSARQSPPSRPSRWAMPCRCGATRRTDGSKTARCRKSSNKVRRSPSQAPSFPLAPSGWTSTAAWASSGCCLGIVSPCSDEFPGRHVARLQRMTSGRRSRRAVVGNRWSCRCARISWSRLWRSPWRQRFSHRRPYPGAQTLHFSRCVRSAVTQTTRWRN